MAVPDNLAHSGLTAKEWRKRTKLGMNRGREFETKVLWALDEAQRKGRISGFIYHAPCSPQDQQGKDFTIFLSRNRVFSFGVTISKHHRNESSKKHPKIHCFYFPFEANKEEILRTLILSASLPKFILA